MKTIINLNVQRSLRDLALLVVFIFLSISTQAQTVPNTPNDVHVSWTRVKSYQCIDNPYQCRLTLTVSPSTSGGVPTSYQWEIWRFGAIDYRTTTNGRKWTLGYIEPTDPYTVKVRAINLAGQSQQFSKVFTPPNNCCVY